MANKRIKDLAATATSPAVDDFIAIDGVTNNTRKIAADSFLQDAPENGDLYGREDGAWDVAASVDSLPLTPTFVYDNNIGDTEFVVGNIPVDWQSNNADLTQLSIGNSATTIGSDAFYGCSGFTGDLTIPNSVTSIGSQAFYYCSNFSGSLTIGNGVTSIEDQTFKSCIGFTSLALGSGLTSIGYNAFSGCTGFTGSLTIPNSVTSIGDSSFDDCSGFTGSLTLGNSVTTIGSSAFYYCAGFTGSLIIPNSVTSIGNSAFYGCTGFTGSLIIPNSVTSIGDNSFQDCSGLTAAYLNQPIGQIESYAFYNTEITNVFIGPSATGYTLGAGKTIGDKSGITVAAWTNYPNVP